MKGIVRPVLVLIFSLIIASLILLFAIHYMIGDTADHALIVPLVIVATISFAYGLAILYIRERLLVAHSKLLTTFDMTVGICRLILFAAILGIYAYVAGRALLIPFTICVGVFYFIIVGITTSHWVNTEKKRTITK